MSDEMGNTYGRRKAVVCYPCEAKDTASFTDIANVDRKRSFPRSDEEAALESDEITNASFVDYAFLRDQDSVEYLKRNKVLFILRGLPGSGKSFITRILLSVYPDSIAFTADTYLLKHPQMILNPRILEEAHRHCMNAVAKKIFLFYLKKQILRSAHSPVIVDNTNVSKQEVKQYLRIAKAYGYLAIVVEPRTPWRFTPPALCNKTNHKVELAVVQNRLNNWQDMLPPAYACFMSYLDSKSLFRIVEPLLEKVLKSEIVLDDLARFHGKEISWKDAVDGYLKHKKDPHEMLKWMVVKGTDLTPDNFFSVGKVVDFKVVCFLLTPKHFGAKITSGKLKVLSGEPSKSLEPETTVMSIFSGSALDMTVDALERVGEFNELYAKEMMPGAIEQVNSGVRIVRLEPYSYAVYSGKEYHYRGLFTGCYL